ncbi:MAG: TIGR03087 family PEP-CTERM/XrtA system glycosyltransferase [Methylococcales bacterium]
MKDLLFLVHRIPYPPNKGDKIRSYNFLKHLVAEYNVYLGAFIDDANDWQYTEKLDELCKETHFQGLNPLPAKIKSLPGLLTGEALSLPYYRNQAMQTWVDSTIKNHGIKKVLIFSSTMAQYINSSHAVDMIVDFVDVDSDKWRQYAEKKHGIQKWIYQREAAYLFKYEQKIAEQAKVSSFVSEMEAALFKSMAPALSHKITHINNGVDTDYHAPELSLPSPYSADEMSLVFTGAMDYWANVDAVKWFAEAVFPAISAQHATAKFYIVGSKPTKEVQDLAGMPNVIVTGAVPDVRPYVAHAKLAVAPLRIARGIQNKVLEAMALGKYVLATSAAMEGIAYDQTLQISVADQADSFADAANQLLAEPGSLDSLQNREFVKTHFSWQQSIDSLLALLQ